MKLLMIANSFGVNLQTYAKQIAEANNCDLDIFVLYIGGCSLDTHFRNIEGDIKGYELYHNGKSTGEMISIKDALLKDKWDYVSLQQASHMCGIIETYYPYFEKVYKYVEQLCPDSEIIFHKTWSYSPINSIKFETVPSFYPDFKFETAEEMKKALDYCCDKVCNEFGIKLIINSGDVCEKAMKDFGDVYDCQGFHMNELGCYLIGANLIKKLFKIKLNYTQKVDNLGQGTCNRAIDFINNNF